MSNLSLRFFGPPQIERDGVRIHIGRRKAVALLAYLAVTRRPHGRDHLAALLWPELNQRQARAMLRSVLVTLNQSIGVCWLGIFDDQIALSEQPELMVDVTRFRHLCEGAAAHPHPSLAACNACVLALADAADIGASPFLAGFALSDAPEFDLWQSMQCDALHRELAAALEQLALVHAGAGPNQLHRAIDYARRWLALDPLHESAHRLLMLLYADAGDRAAALRQFDECSRVLRDELSADPPPETVALRDRIVAGDRHADHERQLDEALHGGPLSSEVVGHATLAQHNSALHGFPVAPTAFIGRTDEIAYIVARLSDPACRLLTIVGPGGIGKTRLAIEVARALAPRFAGGAWFVDLAPASRVAVLPTVLLKCLDAPVSGRGDARTRLLAHLTGKQLLLVLDNFEHLIDGAELLVEILAAAAGVRILVTSRGCLHLREEWLAPLAGMALPPALDEPPMASQPALMAAAPAPPGPAVDLQAFDATRLFLQCVRRLRPDFAPDAHDAQLVTQLCRHLEGMPLGIELAASWIRTLSLRDLAAEVSAGLRRLESPLQNVPARHRSISAVFDQSWRLLPAHERAILASLSVFRGGFTQDAARQVAGTELADLGRLIDDSWLRAHPDARYDMHELVRQYCEEHLLKDAEFNAIAEEVRRRHCRYYGGFLSQLARRMNDGKEATAELLIEFGNLQSASLWGIEHNEMAIVCDMVIGLYFIGDMLGWYQFVIHSYAPLAATLTEMVHSPKTDPTERQHVLLVLAWLEYAQAFQYLDLGLVSHAREAASRCSTMAAQLDEGDARRKLLTVSGWLTTWSLQAGDETAESRRRNAEQLVTLEQANADSALSGTELRHKFWLAHAYAARAISASIQGEYIIAEEFWLNALALREEVDV